MNRKTKNPPSTRTLRIKLHLLLLIPVLLFTGKALAQPGSPAQNSHDNGKVEFVKGVITSVPDKSPSKNDFVMMVKVKILEGKLADREMEIPIPVDPPYSMKVTTGDKVMVVADFNDSPASIGIEDFYRISGLIPLLAISILPVIAIGGKKGITSLAALTITVFLIFGGMTRILLAGVSPVFTGICTSGIVTVLTLLLIAGKGKKTIVAVTGTIGGLLMAALLAWLSSSVLHLSGLAGHESVFLQGMQLDLDFKSLLLCAMIIGALGAVMDVCMSIASSLEELAITNPEVTPAALLSSGIKIGSDMLGTMTNTLVLAYTGSSLTLILLISAQGAEYPLLRLMNMEFICVEIVRSASGLFGMAASIPISAFAASILFTKSTAIRIGGRRNKKRPQTNVEDL